MKAPTAANPVAAETASPRRQVPLMSATPRWRSLSTAAPATMGVAMRKESSAASVAASPRNSPALIVAPERDTPGITAKACAAPTRSRERVPAVFHAPVCDALRSAHNMTPLNAIRQAPMRRGSRNASSADFSNSRPTMTAGIVASAISPRLRPSSPRGSRAAPSSIFIQISR